MLPLLLAGAGLLQGMEDSKEQKKDKQAQAIRDAAMIRYSPWSGISADKFAGNNYATPSATSSGLAGAAALGKTGLNFENAMADQDLAKQMAKYYTANQPTTDSRPSPAVGSSPWRLLNKNTFGDE